MESLHLLFPKGDLTSETMLSGAVEMTEVEKLFDMSIMTSILHCLNRNLICLLLTLCKKDD